MFKEQKISTERTELTEIEAHQHPMRTLAH